MDQVKIGKFISDCRKEQNLTQKQLADELGVSDRAVSKWERGINLPDASLMLELSKKFSVSVNEILSGEKIESNDYVIKCEETLLSLKKDLEKSCKRLLISEIVMIIFSTIIFCFTVMLSEKCGGIKSVVLILLGFVVWIPTLLFCMIIELKTGCYECKACGHRYIPTIKNFFIATHMGWTRKLKCPNCGKKSWSKKVVNKE